jgi:hypothetical protein
MNDYQIGMFGYFEFTIRKKDKYGEYITAMSGHWEIIDSDEKNIELSDGMKSLIVTKRRITKFEEKEKSEK